MPKKKKKFIKQFLRNEAFNEEPAQRNSFVRWRCERHSHGLDSAYSIYRVFGIVRVAGFALTSKYIRQIFDNLLLWNVVFLYVHKRDAIIPPNQKKDLLRNGSRP